MSASSLQLFLRDSDSGDFYKHPDAWVSNPAEATAFESPNQALEQRSLISKPKLEMVTLDDRGNQRFGVRLWKDGPAAG